MPVDPRHQAIYNALTARSVYSGEVSLPCVPSALEHFVTMLDGLFQQMGKPLAPHEMTRVRELLSANLNDGYRQGACTVVVVQYQVTTSPTLKKNLGVRVGLRVPTLAQQFEVWAEKRGEVLFGTQPDARVVAVADQLSDHCAPILDVGAGPGRNAIPLARRGHSVDAVEMTPEFCNSLEKLAESEKLPIRVIRGDLLDQQTVIPVDRYALVIATEVVSHFRYGPCLRDFTTRMSQALRSGGRLLFNMFLPRGSYQPDKLAREMAEVAWATLFSREDLDEALHGLPLRQIADDSVYDYEKAHLSPTAWPPTGWFEAWSRGWSIFPFENGESPPVEMRWLLFERE